MSNFICSECGMTNIDCGYAGYKTPKEIELEKKVEHLQEQLDEANEILKIAIPNPIRPGGYGPILDEYIKRTLNYFKKWKV